jgi:hypothetical protein
MDKNSGHPDLTQPCKKVHFYITKLSDFQLGDNLSLSSGCLSLNSSQDELSPRPAAVEAIDFVTPANSLGKVMTRQGDQGRRKLFFFWRFLLKTKLN